ncbi:MAG: hypothetical protein M3Y87_10085 [Myxococcota bacterium]|nr:hypothetical protein [Myxococcota bacterium]
MHTRTPRMPRPRTTLKSAELRRLDSGVAELEALAGTDPILLTMLAAARACRAKITRDSRG